MAVLSSNYRQSAIRVAQPLPQGADAFVCKMVGKAKSRSSLYQQFEKLAKLADDDVASWASLHNEDLKLKLSELKNAFQRSKQIPDSLAVKAFSAVREASKRTTGKTPYLVQMAGAFALFRNHVIEMSTGEGKTLTAAVAAIVQAWRGFPCHVLTVNDYLASRDATELSTFFNFCHVSVGCVTGDMNPNQRKDGYGKDVTYTTAKEMMADFLRDRLFLGKHQNHKTRLIRSFTFGGQQLHAGLVTRGIHTVIVDEADSILIDEAVTPLLISKPQENSGLAEACRLANDYVRTFVCQQHYTLDPKYKDVELLPVAIAQLDAIQSHFPAFIQGKEKLQQLIRQAIIAKEYYHPNKQYVVQNNKVIIVDEFTGRLMPNRTWQAGLHQLIEAKEGLPVSMPSETLARLSFQRFFRFYKNVSGMTGTALEAKDELWHLYGLPMVKIPENKSCQRILYPRKIFASEAQKWDAILSEIIHIHHQGRPILVGTRSVHTSQKLADKLAQINLPFRLLNAVLHKDEARIIAKSGEFKNITIATNMAGRGTDIVLGAGVAQLGGLHVIATECHESARIDRQLFGRSARQGDPGSGRSFISLDDELIVRYIPKAILQLYTKMLTKNSSQAITLGNYLLAYAQKKASHQAYKQRQSVLRYDTWLDDSLSFSSGDIQA